MQEQENIIQSENEQHNNGKYVRVRRKRKSNISNKYIGILSVLGIVIGAIIAGFGAILIVNLIITITR